MAPSPFTAPFLTAACFYGSHLYAAFKLEKPLTGHDTARRRRIFNITLAATATTYALSAVCSAMINGSDVTNEASASWVTSQVSLLLFWAALWRYAQDEEQIRWDIIATTTASAITVHPTSSTRLTAGLRDQSKLLALACWGNLAALAALLIVTTWYHFRPAPIDEVKAPKKRNGAKKKPATANDDEGFDADADSDDEDYVSPQKKELLEKQQARLEEAGDWFTYLAAYRVFLPFIFPFGNRKLQVGVVYLVFHLAFTQIISFLVPHQMGRIADKLAEAGNLESDFPIADIVIWGILQFFESELCYTVRSVIYTPIYNFVYKSICETSFRHVMSLSMDFHHDKSSSDTIGSVRSGQSLTEIVSFICFDLSPLMADIFIAGIYITSAFEPYLLLIMLVAGVLNCWLAEDSNKWIRKERKAFIEVSREMSKSQYEALSNWQTVSQFNHNEYESNKYAKHLDDFCVHETKISTLYNVSGTIRGSFMLAARLAATALIMFRVSQGKLPLGQLLTFTAVWGKVMDPMVQLTRLSRQVQRLLTDSERLLILLNTKPSVQDRPDAKEFQLKAGEVEFDHVDFAYDVRKPTLTDITFKAPAGSTVALVGETGGGKTSLIRLLYRYYDVSKGAIRIDGQDIRDVTTDSFRSVFGFVPQDPALFNTNLLENLRYARLDATDEEIEEACRAACIHDKIQSFPDGYKSKVGERGVKLSGGEMQRVAVARAILRKPKIVLLDEATSMIDAETEHLIQKALRRLTAGRTTFVVAHRLSTIQHADIILVIENGKIIEQGNHEELFRRGGKYVKLWSRQMSKDVTLVPPQATGVETPPHSD